jgi:hypothetical protein
MTAKISASADGLSGSLAVGSTNAANFTAAGGIPFMKNVLINGNLAINQRGVTIAAAANGSYGPDRWKKVDSSNMTQIVEAGNFRPSTQYVLSGTGVTTQVLTSPASGNWTIPNIPITATNVQLEEGSIATPFEQRPIGLELSLCQRYYEKFTYSLGGYAASSTAFIAPLSFNTTKRVVPVVTISSLGSTSNVASSNQYNVMPEGFSLGVIATTTGGISAIDITGNASAEL